MREHRQGGQALRRKQLAFASTEQKNQALLAAAAALRDSRAATFSPPMRRISAKRGQDCRRRCSIGCVSTMRGLRPWRAACARSRPHAIPSACAWPSGRGPNGMQIQSVCVPLGVIGIIYESRPNVTADAGALCLKSGNAVILRGGSESSRSSAAIHALPAARARRGGAAADEHSIGTHHGSRRRGPYAGRHGATASMSSCRAAERV